jgi:hypothetical protein
MSGIPTHVGAFESEFFNGMIDLGINSLREARNPQEAVGIFLDALRMMGRGMQQAATDHSQYIWKTGADPSLFRDIESLRTEEPKIYWPGIFETGPTQRWLAGMEPTKTVAGIGKIIDVPYRQLFRTVGLLHNLIYSGYGRGTEYLAALHYARSTGKSFDEGRDFARSYIEADQGQRKAFADQADSEGLKGAEKRMRVQELIDLGHPGQTDDELAARTAIMARADRWGTRANFMQEPEGLLGLAGKWLADMTSKVPFLKGVAPFTRIPVNLVNDTINLTPLGFARYLNDPEKYFSRFGQIKLAPAQKYFTRSGLEIKLAPDELEDLKANLLGRAITGTGLLMATASLAAMGKIPGTNLNFSVHGAGPEQNTQEGKKLYYQLLDSGWVPNSLQIGNTYLPFEFMPFFGLLQAVGNWQDSYRYAKNPDPETALNWSLTHSFSSLLERGSLKGLSDALDILLDKNSSPYEKNMAWERQLAGYKNYIPIMGANLVKQTYQQFLDNRLYESKGPMAWARDIPFAAPLVGLKPVINFFGEPIHIQPYAHRFISQQRDDEVWDFIDRHDRDGALLAKPSANAKINGQQIKENDNNYYNYTGFRGTELKRLIEENIPRLEGVAAGDPQGEKGHLKREIGNLEKRADFGAKKKVIAGETYDPGK